MIELLRLDQHACVYIFIVLAAVVIGVILGEQGQPTICIVYSSLAIFVKVHFEVQLLCCLSLLHLRLGCMVGFTGSFLLRHQVVVSCRTATLLRSFPSPHITALL